MSKGIMWIVLCAAVGLLLLLAGLSPAQEQNMNAGNMNSNTKHKNKHDNMNSNMSGDMSGNMNTNSNSAAAGLSAMDRKFVTAAGMGGMEEVELGRVAVEHGASDEVKQFGQRMVDDHTRAGDQLKQVAAQKGITLPTTLDAKHQAEVDKMAKLSGAAFDRAYMKDMVKDHQKDVKEFQNESNKGQDADVKSFASTTLPTLQEHLRMAEEVNGHVSGHAGHTNSNMNMNSNSNMSTNSNNSNLR